MLIKELHKSNDLAFVKNSLLSLRNYYNDFGDWFDNSVVPNIDETRFVYVALEGDKFAGALILKKTKEIKVCTLYVHPDYQFNHIGGDFLSIASQTLQTNKLPISLSDDVKKDFFNNTLFNFVLESESQNKYCKGKTEYFGYIKYHEQNSILRILKRSKGKIVIDEISFLIENEKDPLVEELRLELERSGYIEKRSSSFSKSLS